MANLLFHTGLIDDRGSIAAVSEYIRSLTKEGHEIVWAYDKSNSGNRINAIQHYGKYFNLEGYTNFLDFSLTAQKKFDWAYFLKKGTNDGLCIPNIPNNIHVVFNIYEPHGSKYAYISKWLADHSARQSNFLIPKGRSKLPNPFINRLWVPFGVDMPLPDDSLRSEWGISEEARICIRLGGETTFDIPWVQNVIIDLLENDLNFYFIGYNTNKFINHKRALFFPAINSKQEKANALHSSDIFLHARKQGESFGMAILEAMQVKVPVIAWKGGWDKNHTKILSNESLYKNENDLRLKLKQGLSMEAVRANGLESEKYRPSETIKIFKRVFNENVLHYGDF
jgi:glycosyltransferase involved in cell wall biosynthesis